METQKEKSAATKTVVGGGVGGAIAVLIILLLPEGSLSAEKAAMATVALSTVISYVVRYFPAPKR